MKIALSRMHLLCGRVLVKIGICAFYDLFTMIWLNMCLLVFFIYCCCCNFLLDGCFCIPASAASRFVYSNSKPTLKHFRHFSYSRLRRLFYTHFLLHFTVLNIFNNIGNNSVFIIVCVDAFMHG